MVRTWTLWSLMALGWAITLFNATIGLAMFVGSSMAFAHHIKQNQKEVDKP